MSIKFVCSCGKRLRARDEMAARRSVCPRCGSPVGIPSLRPNHPEIQHGPMTPAERVREQMRRLIREAPPPEGAPALGIGVAGVGRGATVVPQRASEEPALPEPPKPKLAKPPIRRGGHYCSHCRGSIEGGWYLSLLYPLRGVGRILAMAAALTVLIVVNSFAIPEALAADVQPAGRVLYVAPSVICSIVVVGYLCAFLDCVLAATAAGDARHVVSPGNDPKFILRSALVWTVCFLAGPVVIASVALLYWIRCGDPDWVDWLILAQLCLVAVSYWLLVLVTVARRDRILDATPMRAAALFELLGYRILGGVLLGAGIIIGHAFAVIAASQVLHRDLGAGIVGLVLACTSGLFWTTFLFRLLGGWLHLAESRTGAT
jgi:hypothetical protein